MDSLHLRSGLLPHLICEQHGNMHKEICEKCRKVYYRQYDTERGYGNSHVTGRKCDWCGAKLLDTIVNFGENLLEEDLMVSLHHSRKCDLALVLGTRWVTTDFTLMEFYLTVVFSAWMCNQQPHLHHCVSRILVVRYLSSTSPFSHITDLCCSWWSSTSKKRRTMTWHRSECMHGPTFSWKRFWRSSKSRASTPPPTASPNGTKNLLTLELITMMLLHAIDKLLLIYWSKGNLCYHPSRSLLVLSACGSQDSILSSVE